MPTINLATLRVKLTADNAEYQRKSHWVEAKDTGALAKVFRTAIAGAAVAAFAMAAKAAIDFAKESSREFQQFDKQIREVYTLMPGMSTKAMDAMSGDVLAFSARLAACLTRWSRRCTRRSAQACRKTMYLSSCRVASDAAAGSVTGWRRPLTASPRS